MSTNEQLGLSREKKDNTLNSPEDKDNEILTSLALQKAQDEDMDTSDHPSKTSDGDSSYSSDEEVLVTEVRQGEPITFGSPPIEGSKSMLLATLGCGGIKNCTVKRKLGCVANEHDEDEESRLSPNSEWINKRDDIFPSALKIAEDLRQRRLEQSQEAVPMPQKQVLHQYQLDDLFSCSDHHSFQKVQLSLLRDNFVIYDTFYVAPRSKSPTQNREAMCTHCLRSFRMKSLSKSPCVVMNERKALSVHLKTCEHFRREFKATSLNKHHYTALFMKEPNKDWEKHFLPNASEQSVKQGRSVTSMFQDTSLFRKPKKGKDTQQLYSNTQHSKSSPGDTTISTKANTVQPPITLFAHPSWKKEEKKVLDNLMLEFVIDCAVPFHIVERKSFHRLLECIRPGTSEVIPKRTKLGTVLLDQAAEEAVRDNSLHMVQRIMKGHSFGMVMDSWSNIKKEHIEAVAACFGSSTFLVESIKETRGIHNGVYIANQWELLMGRLQEYMESIFMQHKDNVPGYMNVIQRQYIRCNYMNTDSAGQCGRAKRILARKYPYRLFLPCWAHQVNLMVRFVVNIAGMKEVFAQAVLAANDLRASSSKFLVMITNECENLYGTKAPCAIRTVAETRWNSAQGCLASLLRIRTACVRFTEDHFEHNGFCDSWLVFSSEDFWTNLLCVELMIRPLCDASFLMQRKKNTLAHVMLMLMNIFHHLRYASDLFEDSKMKVSYKKKHEAIENTNKLAADLERRWREVDHHVYFLAFALHPLYRTVAIRIIEYSQSIHGNWTEDKNVLSVTRLIHAAKCYYFKFQLLLTNKRGIRLSPEVGIKRYNDETAKLGKYLTQWLKGTSMGGITSDFDAITDDPVEWWSDLLVEYGPLANLAMFLLDAPVQSATCEEIFKHYAAFHTKKRNQLGSTKVYKMTQVKYNMNSKYGSKQETRKEEKINRQKNKPVSPIEHKKIVADFATAHTIEDESKVVETVETVAEDEVVPVEVEEWLDLLEEMEDDDDKETNEQEEETEGDDIDLTLDFFAIDTLQDRNHNRESRQALPWPDWTNYDGHDTFSDWPQDNSAHQKKMKREYGVSYVRTDKYSLARLCESWNDTPDGFPSMEGSYGQDYSKKQ